MSDEKKSGRRFSFFGGIKQKMIDDLASAAARNSDDGVTDPEELRQDQLAILGKAGAQTESVKDIMSNLKTDVTAVQAFADGGARTLNELLVSTDALPFRTFADLDARFGALPKGYSYRYLAPPTFAVDEAAANVANNVVRLPCSFNLVIDGHFELFGDEIFDNCLFGWLDQQPAEVYRLWSLRVLSLFGILEKSELPAPTKRGGSVPVAGSQRAATMPTGPEVAEHVQNFAESAVMQYDCEVNDRELEARDFVYSKMGDYEELLRIGPLACLALSSLFSHPDIGVRVSAATYLLPSAPDLALPVLHEAAAAWPENNDDRVQRAAYHAQQAIWMYEDGNLKLLEKPRE